MPEGCPLSNGLAPGLFRGGNIPSICIETCEQLWDEATSVGLGDNEVYPYMSKPELGNDCVHALLE